MIPPKTAFALQQIRNNGIRLKFEPSRDMYEIIDGTVIVDRAPTHPEAINTAIDYIKRRKQ